MTLRLDDEGLAQLKTASDVERHEHVYYVVYEICPSFADLDAAIDAEKASRNDDVAVRFWTQCIAAMNDAVRHEDYQVREDQRLVG